MAFKYESDFSLSICNKPFHFISDPFADANKEEGVVVGGREGLIHIRIQQRNGRKTLTTVQGLPSIYDLKKIAKACKKVKKKNVLYLH